MITPKQRNKLLRPEILKDKGVYGVAEELNRIDDKIEAIQDQIPSIEAKAEEAIKIAQETSKIPGPQGPQGEKGESIIGPQGPAGPAGETTIVEKVVVEKHTETIIKEQPIVTHNVKNITTEVAVTDEPIVIAKKLNTLREEMEPEVIKGWSDLKRKVDLNANIPKDFDVRIGVSKTEIKRLTDRVVVLEATPGGGGTWGSITGTLADQTDLQTAIDAKANSSGALTQFLGNGNWKVWYSDGSGDVKELALGASGTFLKSNGASSAPTFAAAGGGGASPESKTITRNASGFITSIAGSTKTYTLTRNASNFVTSKTDSTNTWTYTRNASNQITSVAVS